MNDKQFSRMVKQFGGWIEGNIARFNCPHDKDQFIKEYVAQQEKDNAKGGLATARIVTV